MPFVTAEPMFLNEVLPLLSREHFIISKSINLTGIGESNVEMNLKDLLNYDSNINVATYAKETEVEIKITGQSDNDIKALESKMKDLADIIKNRFEDYVYGFDNNPIHSLQNDF